MNQLPVDSLKHQFQEVVRGYLFEWYGILVADLQKKLAEGDTKTQVFEIFSHHLPSPAEIENGLDRHSIEAKPGQLSQLPLRYLQCHGNTSHINHAGNVAQQLTSEIYNKQIPKKTKRKYKVTPLLGLATDLDTGNGGDANQDSTPVTETTQSTLIKPQVVVSKPKLKPRRKRTRTKRVPVCEILSSSEDESEVDLDTQTDVWQLNPASLTEIIVNSYGNVISEDTDDITEIEGLTWDQETNCVFREVDGGEGQYVGQFCLESQQVVWAS